MEQLFKKVLYTGVGIVSTTTEKLQKEVNQWVEKGQLTEDEGKKVVEDLVQDTESKKDEYEGKVKDYVEKFLARFDFPTRQEITSLHEKVAELEAKLEVTEAPKKAAPKKRVARKTPAKKAPVTKTVEIVEGK
ncbi:MAG: phasin family protein [Saprospiraceae bacterium]